MSLSTILVENVSTSFWNLRAISVQLNTSGAVESRVEFEREWPRGGVETPAAAPGWRRAGVRHALLAAHAAGLPLRATHDRVAVRCRRRGARVVSGLDSECARLRYGARRVA